MSALPFEVADRLKNLGANLRLARVRRGLTIQDAADKIGASRDVVMDVERGKPSTGIAVYLAMLWAYGMLDDAPDLADPTTDRAGLALEGANQRQRVRNTETLDDDF